MKTYKEYKNSNIEWIGEIPSHWNIKKIKHTTYVKGRIGWQGLRSDEFLEVGDSYVVTGTDFDRGKINWETCYQITKGRYDEDPYIQLQEDDLLITKDGTIGKIALVKNIPTIATLNSGVFVTRPQTRDYITQYLFWVLQSDVFTTFINHNKSGSTILHLYQNVFNEFKFTCPPITEQEYISQYLDRKTTQIDNLIIDKENLIDLLNEERTSLINQAVTKGLNSDVPMKDSGITGMGKIPSHWNRLQIKRVVKTKVSDGPHETPEWVDEGIPFISAESIKNGKINFEFKRGYITIEQHNEYCKKAKALFGDILFCKSGSTTGKSAIVETDIDFGIWSPLAIIRANDLLINNYFLFQTIQSDFFRKQVETAWTFGTQPNIGMGAIENLWVTLPPINEQKEIVQYIEKQSHSFAVISMEVQKEIELLKEYKTALISEVITGKVDVRDKINSESLATA